MHKNEVILGFSGGIDSSAAARMLAAQGYAVTALTLDMAADAAMVEQARQRAAALGVHFAAVDVRAAFEQQIERYFTESYLAGRTPAPCTRCNERIKWPQLAAYADAAGAEFIATGHYFRIEHHNNRLYVTRAVDRRKDQSYYLWGISQQILRRTLTPMGDVVKQELMAATPSARESMGVCFLHGRNYREYLESRCGKFSKGELVDTSGRVIGHHDGAPCYTIGQKRGLGLPSGMVVVAIDAARNRLVAGPDEHLFHHTLELSDCHAVDLQEVLDARDIQVVIRGVGRNPEGFARISRLEAGWRVELDDPAWASAVGQPAVLYRGDRVVGGGIVERYY